MSWTYKTETIWIDEPSLDPTSIILAATDKMNEKALDGWEYVSMTRHPTNDEITPGWKAAIIFRKQE
jgi:hypothetical protein